MSETTEDGTEQDEERPYWESRTHKLAFFILVTFFGRNPSVEITASRHMLRQ